MLPETDKKVISVLSGGLDSSCATILLVEKYGKDNVVALSFDYGQKQVVELEKAAELCKELGIMHKVLDLKILGEINKGFSANIVGSDKEVPKADEVIGSVQPITYIANRNMIMYSIAAAYAETVGAEYIVCGLQVHDIYGYHDCTQQWVDKMNDVLSENRTIKIKIIAPFVQMSKYEEIVEVDKLDKFKLLKHTLTCYNPTDGESCGECPSCIERITAFREFGIADPIPYSKQINW